MQPNPAEDISLVRNECQTLCLRTQKTHKCVRTERMRNRKEATAHFPFRKRRRYAFSKRERKGRRERKTGLPSFFDARIPRLADRQTGRKKER